MNILMILGVILCLAGIVALVFTGFLAPVIYAPLILVGALFIYIGSRNNN